MLMMGADITLENERVVCGEPVADVHVRHTTLRGIDIDQSLVPLAIDEFPIICVAAVCAEGETRISGAQELRHKESDRIAAMAAGLTALGADLEESDDGLLIRRSSFSGGEVDSFGDHRIAMAFAIAGLFAEGETTIRNIECIDTSYPGFAKDLERIRERRRR